MMKNRFEKVLLLNLKETLGVPFKKRLKNISKKIIFLPKDSQNLYKELKETDCLLVNQGMTVDEKND